MKKIFTLILLVACAIGASATNFKDSVMVTAMGQTVRDTATIVLTKQDNGKYTMALYNFQYKGMGVGNIIVNDIDGTINTKGIVEFSAKKSIKITKGTDPNVSSWMGPTLGDVPIDLKAKQFGNKLYANIEIKVKVLLAPMTIKVVFGKEDNIVTSLQQIKSTANGKEEVYNFDGTRAERMQDGKIYIVRKADGSVVKVRK